MEEKEIKRNNLNNASVQETEENTDVETEQLSFVDDKYRFKLDNFEGPLDLLLHLIKDAKLDIMTVKLADITEQYLEYMQDLDSIDMDRASEFITVAATLLEIKSKHLLPVETEEETEEEDSETLLLQRLKEYELFKQTGARLREIEDINKLYRAPGKETEKVKIIIKDMVLDKLLDAFASEHKRFPFEDLFVKDMTKSEMINVFLALLELLKLQTVRVEQVGIFKQINIISNEA